MMVEVVVVPVPYDMVGRVLTLLSAAATGALDAPGFGYRHKLNEVERELTLLAERAWRAAPQ